MHLPDGYTARAATLEDVPLVVRLLAAADAVDWGEPDYTEGMLRDDWVLPRLDMARDTWLVMDDRGEAAGYGWLYDRDSHREVSGFSLVHPDHRARGIGTYLLERTEERAREHAREASGDDPVTLTTALAAPDGLAHELVEGRGYHPARHFWRMDIPLDHQIPPASVPAGLELRDFRPERDERAVFDCLEEAFAEHWGHVVRPFEEWRAMWMDEEGFDPSLWQVVADGEEMAGAVLGRILDGTGWIFTLGVRAGWRGRGLGQALLRRSFALFADRDIRKASLFVDAQNATGATALYEKVGMQVARQYDFYQRRIR